MAAIAFQQGRKGSQCAKQIETAITAGTGLAVVTVQTNQEGGAAVFFRNAAGHNANHTLMPTLVRQHDCIRQLANGQLIHHLLEDFRFHSLPLPV